MSSEIGGDGKDSSTNASMMGVPISVATDSESSSVCSKFRVCHTTILLNFASQQLIFCLSLFQCNTGYEDEDTAYYQDDEVVVEDVSCCESTCNNESNLRPGKDEPFMVLNEAYEVR